MYIAQSFQGVKSGAEKDENYRFLVLRLQTPEEEKSLFGSLKIAPTTEVKVSWLATLEGLVHRQV